MTVLILTGLRYIIMKEKCTLEQPALLFKNTWGFREPSCLSFGSKVNRFMKEVKEKFQMVQGKNAFS